MNIFGEMQLSRICLYNNTSSNAIRPDESVWTSCILYTDLPSDTASQRISVAQYTTWTIVFPVPNDVHILPSLLQIAFLRPVSERVSNWSSAA